MKNALCKYRRHHASAAAIP